jgi:uncharacterized membrane protein
MLHHLAAYVAVAFAIVILDFVWLGMIARPMYLQGIGHLMAERPDLPVAALFYAVYALGLMVFAVTPPGPTARLRETLVAGTLFGFFAYATYDLTNLATLKQWPVMIAVVDITWGSMVSGVAAGAGRLVFDRFAAPAVA